MDQNELLINLEKLFQTENHIASIINKSGLRCSVNKLTADLGEYYVYHALMHEEGLFESIEPQKISNAPCDFLGRLSSDSALFEFWGKNEIRIEVKTRRDQKGVKHIRSLKPDKFDLLCVVDMDRNYTLNKIHLVKSETANEFLDIKYQRLIFRERMAFMTIGD